jgi:hypothetical protein
MGLSGAGGAGHLDPLLYPWDPPVASGVMDGNEFRPLEPVPWWFPSARIQVPT